LPKFDHFWKKLARVSWFLQFNREDAVEAGRRSGYAQESHETHIMTKKNIVRRIAEELDRTELETKPIVQKTLDAIINSLASEGRVELRNFGVFEVKRRRPRQARNPRTGEKVTVGERFTVTFKPGRLVEERVALEHRGNSAISDGSMSED
jgi:integration host factor subunit beta